MTFSFLRRAVLVLLVGLSACSSAGAAGRTGAVTPPKMLGSDHPQLPAPSPRAGDTRTDIAVMVEANGQPDMSTLRVTGTGASDYRQAIVEWVERNSFEPGRSNGVAVRAEYQTSLRTKMVKTTR